MRNCVIFKDILWLRGCKRATTLWMTWPGSRELTPSSSAPFATNAYDFYVQDSWKLRPSLTLNVGLRYTISSRVQETNGFVTDLSTEEFLKRRIAGANSGTPYIQPLTLILAGANGKGNLYNWDKNNFQPRISVAWSPSGGGFWRSLFGNRGTSAIRTGFALMANE